jgi:hypothetical protein
MSNNFQYAAPRLTRETHAGMIPLELPEPHEIAAAIGTQREAGPSPFADYSRHLTPEGGIVIAYKDIDRSLGYALLRGFAWIVSTGVGARIIFLLGLPLLSACGCLVALAFLAALIVRIKFEVKHTVEIRPDGMIVDGADFFALSDIGTNWPSLVMIDDDPDRMVIAGTVGTRYIEFLTANRAGASDRTPEVLAADLEDAMEQLWGRTELVFSAGE